MMREGSSGAAPWGIGLLVVFLVVVGTVSSLANLVRLDFETTMDVLGWLALIWGGGAFALSCVKIPMRSTWPFFIGLSWLALMPAFRVWFSEDVYVYLDPMWARLLGFVVVTVISSKVKTVLQ